jgi:hypothetical protein
MRFGARNRDFSRPVILRVFPHNRRQADIADRDAKWIGERSISTNMSLAGTLLQRHNHKSCVVVYFQGFARSERVGGDFEAEAPADSATTFRLCVDGSVVATGLAAGQARFLVGEILERIAVPDGDNEVN